MSHQHEDGTEHEHGGYEEIRIGKQVIVSDPDNQPHTHGTLKMRMAGSEDEKPAG